MPTNYMSCMMYKVRVVQDRMAVATSLFGYPVAPASCTVNLDHEQLVSRDGAHPSPLCQAFRSIIKYILLDIISSCVHAVLQTIFNLQHGQTIRKGREPDQRNKVC